MYIVNFWVPVRCLLLFAPALVRGADSLKKDYLAGVFVSHFIAMAILIARIMIKIPAIIRLIPVA